ncbi:DNA cross-link repair 1A protein-like [Schistocerca piceifrons]|uniref:DNA cross-link repair 1A protein-like n=1 Tax=Schistocerca piceifrons TaxID=274613 RepID=UPI001F5EE271|nr:DNA cross-link repair 1A protein-like [Schistocerca piceifrons]XP_049957269.1 DNA cross-link repair 1A protein-like [Schistocerca serialis cubense]
MKILFTSMSDDLSEDFVSFARASQLQSSPIRKDVTRTKLSFSQQKVRRRLKASKSTHDTADAKFSDIAKELDKNLQKGCKKNRAQKRQTPDDEQQFCPLCQMPLSSLNILPEVHVSACSVVWDDLRECPQGKECNETSIFHFKDFSHKLLAEIRATVIDYNRHPSKDDLCDVGRSQLLDNKRIISETSTESSLDLFSDEGDEGGCIKKTTYQAACVNTASDGRKEVSVSSSSQSTYFEADVDDNGNVDTSESVADFNKTNHTKSISSKHSEGNSSTKVPSERFIHHNALTTSRTDVFSGSDESSKSVSILKVSSPVEQLSKNPFKVKKPSNILRNLSGGKNNQFSGNLEDSQSVEAASVDTEKEISACDSSNSLKSNTVGLSCDEDSDSSARTDKTEIFVQKSLQFKGSIKFKGKCDSADTTNLKSPVKSKTIPCNCVHGITSEVPSVEMEINSPKKSLVSPVKVHLTYNKTGWQGLGIDTVPGALLDEVNVEMCNCRSAMHVECTVANQRHTVKTPSPKRRCLEPRFESSLDGLGFSGKQAPVQPMKEVSVVSCVSSGGTYSTNVSYTQKPVVAGDKERKKSAKDEWKKLMDRMKARGYEDMQVVSSESVSSSSESIAPRNAAPRNISGRNNVSDTSKEKKCPFYKKIPDTTFVVDAFQYGIIPGITSYFLTHFHLDHYIGLRKGFSKPIYCSAVTAALVKKKIGVDEKYLTVLELNDERVIGMVRVTALDANHCPGSIMLLFQLPDGRNFLHVGDFRYHGVMKSFPAIQHCSINKLFLDTTYCDPKYDFPSQEEVIAKAIEITTVTLQRCPKTLVVCGTYLIGKEKVFLGISKAIGAKLWARPDKRGVLKCLCDPNIETRLVTKPHEAQVHVLAMKELNSRDLKDHLKSLQGIYSNVLAFRPSGWELQDSGPSLTFKLTADDNVTIYGVPYSEHSSYSELREFVQFLQPEHIVPTVNVGKHAILQRYFSSWLSQPVSSKTQKKLSSYLSVQ